MNDSITSTTSSKSYGEPEPLLRSMGILLAHIAVAAMIIFVLIGVLVISHTIFMKFLKKKE